MHPVEAAYRRFRKSEDWKLLERCLGQQQGYLDRAGLKQWPAGIVLPSGVLLHQVVFDQFSGHAPTLGTEESDQAAMLINTVHVWAAYRQSKTIYEVEPSLTECLARSPWPADTPTAALRLSSLCPMLSILNAQGRTNHVAVTYDLPMLSEGADALWLRISWLVPDSNRWRGMAILHLTQTTLSQCVEAVAELGRKSGVAVDAAWVLGDELVGLALTLLLYLGGDPDCVRIVHPGEQPVKESVHRHDPERYRDLSAPSCFTVGKSFARALERWEIEHRTDPGVESGRSPRPHMRRAHSHLYWTGEGRKQPRVRFLLPISVRGGVLVEEPENPTMTRVS